MFNLIKNVAFFIFAEYTRGFAKAIKCTNHWPRWGNIHHMKLNDLYSGAARCSLFERVANSLYLHICMIRCDEILAVHVRFLNLLIYTFLLYFLNISMTLQMLMFTYHELIGPKKHMAIYFLNLYTIGRSKA